MSTSLRFFVVGAAILCLTALPARADSHPDFKGLWKLNTEKSDFGSEPALKSLTVRIEKCDTVLKYAVTGVDPGGNPFEESVDVPIDGAAHDVSDGRGQVVLKWDGSAIVSENKAEDGSFMQDSKTTLSEDHKTLTRVVDTKSPNGNGHRTEIYDRQSEAIR